jgi:hypothetical protein
MDAIVQHLLNVYLEYVMAIIVCLLVMQHRQLVSILTGVFATQTMNARHIIAIPLLHHANLVVTWHIQVYGILQMAAFAH